jgi:DNA-directed RNA polymerase subunit beta
MSLELPFNTDKQFEDIKRSALASIENSFPVEGNDHKLVLKKLWVDDSLETHDLTSQKEAKLNNKSWAVPVYAAIDLINIKDGQVINSVQRMKLMDLPKITPRASYIVDGNEYQVVNQLRLKPGVYTRIKNNGELESKVNLAKGVNFDILLNQERGVFMINVGTANIKLYPILRDLGVSDQEISAEWGNELLESNQKASRGVMDTEIKKLQTSLMRKPSATREESIQEVAAYFDSTKIDPKTTKMTMGESFDKADVKLLLATSRRLLETARGDKPADDRDSLVYKSLHSVEDFIKERLTLNESKIKNIILKKLDKQFKISEIMNKKVFDDPVKTMFTNTSISAPTEQINPLHMYSGQMKLTIMGEGGIQNEQAVSNGARAVHPSEIGFIDPVMTPQSGQVGAVTRLSIGMKKRGNEILTSVVNPKTGKVEHLDPIDFGDKIIAYADQYTAKEGKLRPLSAKVKALGPDNKPIEVSATKVDYVIVDPKSMFSISTNLIPFLNSTQGNRALMASAQYEQALALKEREQPLVQVDTGLGSTAEEDLGKVLSHTAPVSGIISEIKSDAIFIKDKKGETHKVGIYDDFPLNQKTYLNATPSVQVGDAVKKDQIIADNNYTKDGVLSMGTNLRVAYMPYKGYNFEDGIVISETASKKLTSEHMHKRSISISEGGELSKKKFIAYFPTLMSAAQASKLDDDGVIREGETVNYGDFIIAYMTKNMQTPERMELKRLHRSLLKPYADRHEEWDYEFKGLVSKVMKTSKEVTVYIKTEEQAIIGDKLSGRFGNKGIIANILPDREMPRTVDGNEVEIILNPIGIPSRLNPGQILETAASKVADKIGEPISFRNFDPKSNYEQVKSLMKEHGVKDKEILIDPEDGKPLGSPIMTGKQFITKLDHPVRKKFSARGRGAYTQSDKQPATTPGETGQSMDQLTVYSMLAHGSKDLLREAATYKSEQNDEFWRALQLGHPLPAPKPTFAFNKFVDMLKASGVNVTKEGSKLNLSPMTDSHVDELSSGEIKNPLMLKGKNLMPERGGLFDPLITGGTDGSNWTHFNLSEPIPNPMFENAIKTITGIKQKTYDNIIGGKSYVDSFGNISDDKKEGKTGGEGIKILLEKVDTASKLEELRTLAQTAKPSQLDSINKHIRYLKALDSNDMKPSDYIISKVPIIPPKFRPVYPMEDGSLMTSDPNLLYRDSFLVNEKLDELKRAPEPEKADLRASLYKSVRALQGIGNPVTFKDYRGFVELIKGKNQPKEGFFQKKLIRRRQDLSGRSTIVPDPKLGVDEVGLPSNMAWQIYEPHVVRELIQRGYTPLDAQKQVKEQTPIASRALEAAVDKRPVVLNRSPSLHKFSVMSFKPQLTDGKTIKIHPLVVKGFNADFDGDMQRTLIVGYLTESSKYVISNIYGRDFVEDRSVTARFREQLPAIYDAGQICIFDLEDFPHGPMLNRKDGKNGIIEFYAAIPGMKVLAYSEENGKTEWADVAFWSVHPDRNVELVNLQSGRQIVTDDDPRAVYGVECGKLEFTRNNPLEAFNTKMFVPRADRFDVGNAIFSSIKTDHVKSGRFKLNAEVNLDEDFGYLTGVMAGDGWCTAGHGINLANVEPNILSKFLRCTNNLMDNCQPKCTISVRDVGSEANGSYGRSIKYSVHSSGLAEFFTPLIGTGAEYKHLPAFFFKAPEPFRIGLFAGLMDTDGSVSVSNAKAKPQLMANYSSRSLRLIQEIKLLASTLGIRSRITASKTPAGNPFWVLSFSNYDVKNIWRGKGLQHQVKFNTIQNIEIEMTPALAKNDIVPISFDLAGHITKTLGAKRDAEKDRKSTYTIFAKAKKSGSVSRSAAIKLFSYIQRDDVLTHKDGQVWLNIVDNNDVTWDQVVSFEKTNIRETGYDLTVPGYETFMNTEGVILSNTMSVHVPASEKARVESFKMLPTNNIFNPATGEIMLMPQNEMILGLYLLTKAGEEKNKSFNNIDDAKKSMEAGDITINSIVKISGEKTTLGRAIVNGVLPQAFKDPNIYLDKKGLNILLKEIGHKEKDKFGQVVDALKDLGNQHGFKTGFTIGMEDIAPQIKARDKVSLMADNALKKTRKTDNDMIRIYTAAGETLNDEMYKEMGKQDSALYHMAFSGAKGNLSQLRQITTAPNLVQDHTGAVIPHPVLRSYSEGLDTAGYWNTMYGARAGTIGRSLQSAVPGYFSKRLVSSAMGATVTKEDCGTDKGIEEPIDSRSLIGRFLASGNSASIGKKGEEVNSQVIAKARKLNKSTITVRSPLTCEAVEGVCSMCFGRTMEGDKLNIGDNAGVISATSITEPVMQMGMNAFHTGGVAGAGAGIAAVAAGYDRIAQILELPEIVKGKATLSSEDGKVTNVEKNPAGGHFVFVNEQRHFVPQTRNLSVKKGDSVKVGDYLSDGVIKPQELLNLKGIDAVRSYMTDELSKTYEQPINKNIFEMIVKEMTNTTQVINPGKSTEFEAGDMVPLSKINEINNKGGDVAHNPILKGINTLPLVSEDWLARMGTKDLSKTIREGASRGWSSDIHGTHPIPAYVYGAEFGLGTEGKY